MRRGLESMVGGVALALVVLGQGSVQGQKPDKERAQGTWKVTYAAVGKAEATKEDLKGLKVIVEGTKFTLIEGKRTEVVHISLIGGNPKGIEFRQGPADKKLHWHGIYEFDQKRNRLRLCWGPAEAPRPKSFEHKDQEEAHRLFVLEK